MLVTQLFEDSWSGPDSAWGSPDHDEWYNGRDQWHSADGVSEDYAAANLVQTNEADMSDIVTAHSLIGNATRNPAAKQEYFDFLKHLRKHHGADYSTQVHQEAAKLAQAKESN